MSRPSLNASVGCPALEIGPRSISPCGRFVNRTPSPRPILACLGRSTSKAPRNLSAAPSLGGLGAPTQPCISGAARTIQSLLENRLSPEKYPLSLFRTQGACPSPRPSGSRGAGLPDPWGGD